MQKLFPEAMLVASADRRACRALLRTGSRSFFAASHLLPANVREPATALYAFCRLADDAVDEPDGTARNDRRAALVRLFDRLDRAYRGVPLALPADRAFAETVRRFDMPRALPEALLEGLAWDAEGRRYETLSDLLSYAARVAGAVGAMMAVVMGVRDREALARACDLGAAMQLTNIARDVGEDARAGRLYLPMSWLRDAGIDPETWLAAPRHTPEIGAVVGRLLAEAARLYRAGESGIAALPLTCRPGIRAARFLYADIGHAVARNANDSVTQRAVVSAPRKLRLCLRAMAPVFGTRTDLVRLPPQAEARFLVDAVAPLATPRRGTFGEQVVWVLHLLDRVEQRRAGRQLEGGV
jgi:phytoene synthase